MLVLRFEKALEIAYPNLALFPYGEWDPQSQRKDKGWIP